MGLGHDLLVSAGDTRIKNNLMLVVVQNKNEGKDMIIINWERSSVTVIGVVIINFFATTVTMKNRCIVNGLWNSWEGNDELGAGIRSSEWV